jgi:hypothetical protein
MVIRTVKEKGILYRDVPHGQITASTGLLVGQQMVSGTRDRGPGSHDQMTIRKVEYFDILGWVGDIETLHL